MLRTLFQLSLKKKFHQLLKLPKVRRSQLFEQAPNCNRQLCNYGTFGFCVKKYGFKNRTTVFFFVAMLPVPVQLFSIARAYFSKVVRFGSNKKMALIAAISGSNREKNWKTCSGCLQSYLRDSFHRNKHGNRNRHRLVLVTFLPFLDELVFRWGKVWRKLQ